jgi:prepilin-type N-terminal cleavage/methylation domain-containing protein
MLMKINSKAGVTLIELLIASVIALIATGAALELYISQQKGWISQENITDMQQNGRAGIDEIVHHARQAGYHIPPGLEAIYASDANPDTITFIYMKEPMCDSRLIAPMPQPSSELKLVADSIDCFVQDTWAYIYDPASDYGEFFEITQVQNAAGHLQHNTMDLSIAYPAGSVIYMIEVASFYIDNTTDTLHPKLMIERANGEPHIYADNIEDLQFTYTLAHGTIVDTLITASIVREVNIELVARTDRLDFLLEDDYVRDTLQTSVFVRNLSF